MDRIRVIVGVHGDRRKLDRLITEGLEDPQTSQIVLQKPCSQFPGPDGKTYIVDVGGNLLCVSDEPFSC